MAKVTKTAAAKPAAKSAKPAAKKTAAAKPVKSAAKKTTAAKPAKPAAKKTAAARPAKPAAKKAAATKPVKSAAKKTASAKPARAAKSAKASKTENTPKVLSLFDAYTSDRLPKDQGYIVSSFINGNTGYSIYEVISYSGVKAIYPDGTGLTFQSQGKKLHALIEPPSYSHKSIEPYLRDKAEQIPLRFKEVSKIISKNQSTLYWAKKPIESLSSFTVARPVGFNVSFVFYNRQDIYVTLSKFFEQSFTNDAGLPMTDARKGAEEITAVVKKTMNFKGVYEF
ncbi:MAG: hypothetical protein LBG26_07100 [Treponema sp.]|jgi:hypothetical protein|nr:hypothetical protein [Treponema sp.]